MVRDMMGKNTSRAEIASRLKVPPFVAGKMTGQARAFSRKQILEYVKLCVDAEEEEKQGRISDRLEGELLISRRYGEKE